MIRRYLPKSVEDLVWWYERYISPIALIAGFLLDHLILLRRIDVLQTYFIFFFYLIVAGLGIVLLNMVETGKIKREWFLRITPLIPVAVQFAFGGLFSGFLSLYSKSATFATSWIFVIVVAALLLGNERFTRLYVRFTFQISIYFAVLFSFFIFFLPVVFRQIGPWMFLLSGVVSILCISLFFWVLWRVAPERVKQNWTWAVRSIAAMTIAFNVLYFTNAIPPLPLSLKDAGVYHSITRTVDGYVLTYEPLPWYASYFRYNTVFHRTPGEPVYVWSAIFAPTNLSTTIFHQWQKYDDVRGEWVITNSFSYPIVGGRDGGYRGYSVKDDATPGAWRVRVLTRYGQVIGQVSFTIIGVPSAPELSTKVQ
jgi:hypothetical protein